MSLFKEFREFALKGNMIDLAVGVVIGTAFGKIISALVAHIIMPPLNLLTARAGANFTDLALKIRTEAPVMDANGQMTRDPSGNIVMQVQDYPILNYGPFIQAFVDFLLIAVAIFVVIKMINTARKRFEKEAPTTPTIAPEEIQLLREIRDSLVKK
jgi:large conductance mechanosensitive channel